MRASVNGERVRWFDVRDWFVYLCGWNYPDHMPKLWNFINGKWRWGLFDGGISYSQAKAKLLQAVYGKQLGSQATTALALTFAALCKPDAPDFITLLEQAAELGDGFACAKLAAIEYKNGNEAKALKLAIMSANFGERDGMYLAGIWQRPRNIEMLMKAAEWGHRDAFRELDTDVEFPSLMAYLPVSFWVDYNRINVFPSDKLTRKEIVLCSVGKCSSRTLFAIGQAKSFRTSTLKSLGLQFWANDHDPLNVEERLKSTEVFYKFNCDRYKEVTKLWSLIATRLGVGKDIRLLIARLVWDGRYEAEYNIPVEPRRSRRIDWQNYVRENKKPRRSYARK